MTLNPRAKSFKRKLKEITPGISRIFYNEDGTRKGMATKTDKGRVKWLPPEEGASVIEMTIDECVEKYGDQ